MSSYSIPGAVEESLTGEPPVVQECFPTYKHAEVQAMKPYPKYKDSGVEWIGEVPEGWEIKKLKYHAKICNGHDHKKVWDENGEYPIIGTGGVFGWANDYLHPGPSVILGRKGTIDKPQFHEDAFWSVDTAYYTDIFPNTNPKFFFYLCSTINFDLYKYGSAVPSMTQEVLNQIELTAPSLSEQTVIATYLDRKTAEIDSLITNKERLIELYEEEKKAVINQAVTKGLDPDAEMKDSGVEWLGEIPAHWEVVRTKRAFELVAERSPDNNKFELLSIYTDIGVKPRKELEARGNKATTTDGYWMVKKGDLIVNKLLAWMGAIGISEYNGVTSPAYDILRAKVTLNPKFYHYLFRTHSAQAEFKRWSRGIMEMRLRLYFDEFGRIDILFPPVAEQTAIVHHIETQCSHIDAIIDKLKKQIDLFKEYRTALISEAVTGKIDVRDAG